MVVAGGRVMVGDDGSEVDGYEGSELEAVGAGTGGGRLGERKWKFSEERKGAELCREKVTGGENRYFRFYEWKSQNIQKL